MMPRVLLCVMPFGLVNWPQLGPALLKAGLSQAGVDCDVRYFSLDFARQVGKRLCMTIGEEISPQLLQVGEWIFSRAVFDSSYTDSDSYLSLARRLAPEDFTEDFQHQVLDAQNAVAPFLDHCLESIDWGAYDVIGFSSCYQQQNASLALAKRIKTRWPGKPIIFGGSSVEGEMGVALLRSFDFVDYVCLGEGDLLLPEFVRRVGNGDVPDDLTGLAYRKGKKVHSNGHQTVAVPDLDSLPYPDYDDFFKQYLAIFSGEGWNGRLQLETSRGCRWGERAPCAFCGISRAKVVYREKSPKRAQEEIRYLVQRYQPRMLSIVDNIVPRDISRLMPPSEEGRQRLFFDIRPTTSKQALIEMKESGADGVLIGIETLSTRILALMNKGSDLLTNIRVLKWCRMLGIAVAWNFLYGIPSEDPAEYEKMADLIPALSHLTPPGVLIPILLLRFSPYFEAPDQYGFEDPRPAASYAHIYPGLSESVLRNLANQFDFKYADNRDPERYITFIHHAVAEWRESSLRSILTCLDDGTNLRLFDTRPVARKRLQVLTGLERAVYLACDQQQSLGRLSSQFKGSSGGRSLCEVLDQLVADRLMVSEEDTYLSLAVDIGRFIHDDQKAALSDGLCLSISHALMCTRQLVRASSEN